MQQQLLGEVRQFLSALDSTQDEMLSLFEDKRTALKSRAPQHLLRLADPEQRLTDRMQKLLQRRGRILQSARGIGLAADSVDVLLNGIGGQEADELLTLVEQAKSKSAELRRESWVQWVVTHRAASHYGNLLDMIANCGEKRPTYSRNETKEADGGAILDASI